MPSNVLPKEFEPLSLEFEPRIQVYGTIEVESFTGDQTYVVDLEAQTCTCPNFQEDRLPYAPPNHLGRWCKHLVRVLYDCGTMDELDDWRAPRRIDQQSGEIAYAAVVKHPDFCGWLQQECFA